MRFPRGPLRGSTAVRVPIDEKTLEREHETLPARSRSSLAAPARQAPVPRERRPIAR